MSDSPFRVNIECMFGEALIFPHETVVQKFDSSTEWICNPQFLKQNLRYGFTDLDGISQHI